MTKYLKFANIAIYTILIVVVISEFFLLHKNFTLKEKVGAYQHLEELLLQAQEQLSKFEHERRLEGKSLWLFSQEQLYTHMKGTYKIINAGFVVLFYFDINDCSSCLTNEIATWNEFAALYHDKICQVIGIMEANNAINPKLLKYSFGIKFPVMQIDSMKIKLVEYGIKSTPVVLFGDIKINKCIYAFFPTVRVKSSEGFVQKLQSFLVDGDLQTFSTVQ
jgi:hypothetical protein